MTHAFSPIDSKIKYTEALEYLMVQGCKLAETILGEEIVPDTLTIFSRTQEEYDFIDGLIRTFGTKSRFTHGITLYIDVDMEVGGQHVVLLGVRESDDDRQDIGYADFSVDNYFEIRDLGKRFVHEITTSRGQSLLELRHPDFDIRGYLVAASEHGSLLDELCFDLEQYHEKWHEFVRAREDKKFFESLRPTALAWKVFDRAEFDRCMNELRDMCDQIHFGWVNGRWLATLHLKDEVLSGSVKIIKLMERRPGSNDPVGLDHLDFIVKKENVSEIVAKEPDLKWSEESNGEHCTWISLWFSGTEAKLRADTVLQVCVDELLELQQTIDPV
jgi:hypothetical protein